MEYQIAIYSTDSVFARMLELEFATRGLTVLTADAPSEEYYSDIVLLDLDSSVVPPQEHYRRMIGFTRGSARSTDESHRLCSLILHRPFEMRLLRREVLGKPDLFTFGDSVSSGGKDLHMCIDDARTCLLVGEKRLELSPKELQVMECLIKHRGESVSREMIASVIGESCANKTDVYVCFLRRKLEAVLGARVIKTERGKGYKIP